MFCSKCGTQNPSGTQYCVSCGAALTQDFAQPQAQAQPQQTYQQPQPQSQQPYQPQQQYQQQHYQQPQYAQPTAGGQADPRDIEDNKLMSVLAYIIFFVPLIAGAYKTSPYARFHTNQGTVLALSAIAYGIAMGILSFILVFIPVVGWILIVILSLLSFVFLVLVIMGIVNAVSGRMKQLPLIGKIRIIK